MATRSGWTGWIGFAGCLMVVIGGIDFFEGLIAAIRGSYYAVTPNQIIVFNLTTWGWIMIIWGIILVMAGFGLLAGAGWARWFAIVAGLINFFIQLGFVGDTAYPLWALCGLALHIIVLWALMVDWGDARRDMGVCRPLEQGAGGARWPRCSSRRSATRRAATRSSRGSATRSPRWSRYSATSGRDQPSFISLCRRREASSVTATWRRAGAVCSRRRAGAAANGRSTPHATRSIAASSRTRSRRSSRRRRRWTAPASGTAGC